eukprot:7015089-Lingulodinium_polyedra.AAC.1
MVMQFGHSMAIQRPTDDQPLASNGRASTAIDAQATRPPGNGQTMDIKWLVGGHSFIHAHPTACRVPSDGDLSMPRQWPVNYQSSMDTQ